MSSEDIDFDKTDDNESDKSLDKSQSNDTSNDDKKESINTSVIQKTDSKASTTEKSNYETLIVTQEVVQLYEHRITEWQNRHLVSDVRKLLAAPCVEPMRQKIVTTEKITLKDQTLEVPVKVDKQIGGKSIQSDVIGIPVKVQQMDVPVIETIEFIDIPIKTTTRTTEFKPQTNH